MTPSSSLRRAQPTEAQWRAWRALFPALARCTYLSTASAGPVSVPAARAARRYYELWSQRHGDAAEPRIAVHMARARQSVARMLGAASEEIAFVPNTSTAISCAALLLGHTGAVLTGPQEHPSVVTPWLARGCRVDVTVASDGRAPTTEDYARAVKPDTRVIAISHVRYNDGVVNDIKALARVARSAGAHLIVDATQSAGILPIDVGCGIDILGFAGFKWLNAGDGSGALFVARGLLERYGLPIAGNRSRRTDELEQVERLEPLLEARAFELGTPCAAAALALGAAVALIERIGPQAIHERVAELSGALRTGLKRLGFRMTGADRIVSPIVSVFVSDPEQALRRLARRGIRASLRARRIRLGVSWYNSPLDIRRCLQAFEQLVPA